MVNEHMAADVRQTETKGAHARAAALRYVRKGLAVFPCHARQVANGQVRCTCTEASACKSIAKHPRTRLGLKEAEADVEFVEHWWKNYLDANVAIATGAKSGIIVLDIDPRHGGDEALATIEAELGELPDTPTVETGGGGLHLYFAAPAELVRNSAGKLGRGLDVRGDGGYVIAPPSIHGSGRPYTFKDGHGLDDLALAELPTVWLERVTNRAPVSTGSAGLAVAEGIPFTRAAGTRPWPAWRGPCASDA